MKSWYKIISIIIVLSLVGCRYQKNTSDTTSEDNNSRVVISNEPDFSSGITEAAADSNMVFSESDVLIFHGSDQEYYKNDVLLPIEGELPIIKNEMLYFPLEFIFDLFKFQGYEEFTKTGHWENEFGEIYCNGGYIDFATMDNNKVVLSTEIFLETHEEQPNWGAIGGYQDGFIQDGTIYIPANLLEYMPIAKIENMVGKHHAKYFPNAQLFIFYGGITPALSLPLSLAQKSSDRNWEEIYTDIVNGTDALGRPYNFVADEGSEDSRATYVLGYTLYDFDKDGIPELLVEINTRGPEYCQVFTVENGHSKYLGDIYMTENREPGIIEKRTGYMLAATFSYPCTYLFENGRFIVDTEYVKFEKVVEENGYSYYYKPIPYSEEDVWHLNLYSTIEEAIKAYPDEAYN